MFFLIGAFYAGVMLVGALCFIRRLNAPVWKTMTVLSFPVITTLTAWYVALPMFWNAYLGPQLEFSDDGRGFGTGMILIGFIPSCLVATVTLYALRNPYIPEID